MAHVQRVRQPVWHRSRAAADDRDEVVVRDNYFLNVLSRIIWLAAGIITLLLAFRFILALLAANPGNGFVNFIYTISHPFAVPFFGMFHYNDVYVQGSGSHFEVYTLVAMAVYLAAAWVLTALVNIGRR
jgi:hypothetical protein